MNENVEIYNLIISLIKCYHSSTKSNNGCVEEYQGKEISLGNGTYFRDFKKEGGCVRVILDEVLRWYSVSEENLYISKKAYEKWREISNDSIWNYHDNQLVKLSVCDTVELKVYSSANNHPDNTATLAKGESFILKSVFHTEHITDVISIIEELVSYKDGELTYENVHKTLNKICIARILKEEDRGIKKKSKRGTDFSCIYNDDYKKAGITLLRCDGSEVF